MKPKIVILNVDDDHSVRDRRSGVLRQAGYEVLEASTGAEALQSAAVARPGLIILDSTLPDMDGFEMCRRVKTQSGFVPTLVLDTPTTSVDHARPVRGLDEGADGYLTTPVEPTVLLAAVSSLLRLGDAETVVRETKLENARLSEAAERSRLEAERARLEAETASRAKDEFLATVSHELRSPLNALLTWTHLLRGGTLDERATARAVDGIERSTRLQTQLIDDLLDVSRIISGKLRLGMRPVALAPLIEAALEAVRAAAAAKGIRLESHLDGSVGSVYGDPGRLQQVASNLLSNAVKFTPKGGRIAVELSKSDTQAQIVISDTGEGIAAELLPQIFDRFRQADGSTTRRHGGLGLGLAIVRHLIELHGGSVSAASPGVGQGAVFTVVLPLMSARLGSAATALEAGAAQAPSNLAGVHVLVVEDEVETRESVSTMLEQYGARVTAVGSVGEALSALQQSTPDVLISDIGLPEEDGYSLMRKVRALTSEPGCRIPAVALTAYGNGGAVSAAHAAGFEAHVTKPVEPLQLVALIGRLTKDGGERPAS